MLALGSRQSWMRRSWVLVIAAAAWLGVALLTALWADLSGTNWDYTGALAAACAALAGVLAVATFADLRFARLGRAQSLGPWMLVSAAWIIPAILGAIDAAGPRENPVRSPCRR